MLLEVIACTLDDALAAEDGGATRLEVVAHLDRDGLTPPIELVESIITRVSIPVRVMIRPRDAFEVTDRTEIHHMRDTIRSFAQFPIDGLVLGYVHKGRVDKRTVEVLCTAAPKARVTFHRAIDTCADAIVALKSLQQLGRVDCVLMSGGAGTWPERADRLGLMQTVAPEMTVLVGGGVDEAAIHFLCSHTQLRAFHAGRAAREPHHVDGHVSENAVATLRAAMDLHFRATSIESRASVDVSPE